MDLLKYLSIAFSFFFLFIPDQRERDLLVYSVYLSMMAYVEINIFKFCVYQFQLTICIYIHLTYVIDSRLRIGGHI